MIIPRVIPCLLLRGDGLVKGVKFKNHKYVGDPINAVRIFNEKEVDELLFLDISATGESRIPLLPVIEKIADECCMPFGVGGGIRTVEEIRQILYAGAEKVCITTAAVKNPNLIEEAAGQFGSQSIVVGLEVKKNLFGKYMLTTNCSTQKTSLDPVTFAREVERRGAGELVINSVDRDGTMEGFDVELIRAVATAVTIPVIACGGAGSMQDIVEAFSKGDASAASAGSLFVFHGPKRAVLINYPDRATLEHHLSPFSG